MGDYQYCTKGDACCFTKLPLLTVISEWFHENNDISFNLCPKEVIFFIFSLIAWKLIKIFYRIIKSMLKPLLFICGISILIYTTQYSYSENVADFVLNVIFNTIIVVSEVFGIAVRIVFGKQVNG